MMAVAMDKVGCMTVTPYFIVDDVVKSAEHYRDVLGFKFDRFWGEPPCFVMVRRGAVEVMLSALPKKGLARPNHTVDPEDCAWDAYVRVKDVAAILKEYKGSGAKITSGPCDQFYGMREITVMDCNGYILCFGQDIENEQKTAAKKAKPKVKPKKKK